MSKFDNIKTFSDVKKIMKIEIPGFSNELLLDLITGKVNKSNKSKILIVGEVQSGKTRNIIEFINSTFTNKTPMFDIIIVFGGTTRNLNNQTKKRLEDCKFGLGSINQIKFKNFSNLYSEKSDSLRTVLYIGLKSNIELENILFTLKNISNLSKKRVLVIDDESDYGSLNTKELGNPSKYSEIIEKIFESLSKGSSLISVTATPYANLINNKVYPYDYVLTLPCKEKDGYKGISYFNNLPNFYINIENEKLWEVPTLYYKKSWKKLYYVFCIYIINTLIKQDIKKDGFENDRSDLLINVAYNKKDHKEIISNIRDIQKHCLAGLPTFVSRLKSINNNIVITKEKVKVLLDNINLVELNSDQNNSIIGNYNIYVGGVLLSRGITYKWLTVEYITNFPKNKISVDTLLQMCRWFGYRSYLEEYHYINVITNNTGIEALKEVEEFNKIFYEHYGDEGGVKDFAYIKNKIQELEKNSNYVVACGEAKRQ